MWYHSFDVMSKAFDTELPFSVVHIITFEFITPSHLNDILVSLALFCGGVRMNSPIYCQICCTVNVVVVEYSIHHSEQFILVHVPKFWSMFITIFNQFCSVQKLFGFLFIPLQQIPKPHTPIVNNCCHCDWYRHFNIRTPPPPPPPLHPISCGAKMIRTFYKYWYGSPISVWLCHTNCNIQSGRFS